MQKIIKALLLIFFALNLYSLDFKVASYNVENLFDLQNDGTEYREYKPYSKYWNKKAFNIKLKNISKVINELNADIVSLQEIENQNAFNKLLKYLPQYTYSFFLKKETSSIGVAILSKYKIMNNNKISVDINNPHSRPILKSTIKIDNKNIIIYTNHWKSKRSSENTRIPYANALMNELRTLNKNDDYIILGDLNSNYNEYVTFKHNKKMNNTYGITAINQVLNTSINGNLIQKNNLQINKIIHYNLWLELNNNKRYSSTYRGKYITPDNIILSKSLFDNKNIYYINNSFNVFKENYLFKTNKIKRWNTKKHTGYSDHLPIYATFSTKKQKYQYKLLKSTSINDYKIDYLYKIQKLNTNIILKNVIVIYKYKNKAIIKSRDSRAILIYGAKNDLKVSNIYDIKISKIDTYKGLKEINEYEIIKFHLMDKKYKDLYLKANQIDLFNHIYQNEIITKLSGIYKNNYLYFKDKKIRLYFRKGIKYPKNNSKINILKAHLNTYNSKTQLSIYKQSDFKANYR